MANPSPTLQKWKDKYEDAKKSTSRKLAKAGAEASELRKKHAAKMREQTQQSRMSQAGSLVGAHATAIVAGQIHREIGVKREKMMLARILNYGIGAVGVGAAIYGKKSSMRSLGAAAAGMSIGQLAIDTSSYDLVPGFNEGSP